MKIEHIYKEIGAKVADFRIRQHMTQEQLGQMLTPPVTRASIANVEAGKQRVLAHSIVALAEALSVHPNKLLGVESPKTFDDLRIRYQVDHAALHRQYNRGLQRAVLVLQEMIDGRRVKLGLERVYASLRDAERSKRKIEEVEGILWDLDK